MNNNKKFSLVFVLFVLLPLGLIFINNNLAESTRGGWSYDNRWGFAVFCYIVGIVGCTYILVKNYKMKINSKFWYFLGGFACLILIVLLNITSSFSHFGF
jgi:cell division protein FtsW (lipid II flippase)